MNVIRNDKQYNPTNIYGRGRGRGAFGRTSSDVVHSRSNNMPCMNATSSSITPQPAASTTASDNRASTSRASTSSGNGSNLLFKEHVSGGRWKSRRSSSASGPRHHTSSDAKLRTPLSVTSHITDNESCCIIALSEGRGHARGEVGIAAVDVRRPHLTLCQISDSHSYINTLTKINVFNPIQILVPNTFCEGPQPSKLFTSVQDMYPTVTLTTVQRRHFGEARGLQQIQHLCAPEYSSVEMLILHKFYALSSAAALLKYIEFIQNVIFAPKSLKVEYQGSQNTTVIDVDTAHRLELVKCLRGAGIQNSLLGILNHCHTAGGARMLRANILQPPCLPAVIQMRQVCVEEMVQNPELFHGLQSILSKFIHVEHLLTLCIYVPQQQTLRAAETQLNYTLLLKTTLELLPPLRTVLEGARSEFFCAVKENLDNNKFKLILERLQETVHDDARYVKSGAASHMQRCFLVKPFISTLLDIARKTYCEIVNDISVHVARLGEEYNLPLRVNSSGNSTFRIQLTSIKNKPSGTDLPPCAIQVQNSRNTITFTTQELIFTNQRARDVLQEVQLLSNVVVYKLLMDVREHIGCLYKLCENIAELDMLISLTHLSAMSNYVRPQFGNVVDVRKSRHPMLDFISQTEPDANDIFVSKDCNCQIITGPNMSGKSIYIRQIALIQIMAQIGCYVPAENATFRIADHIFSRIGFDDSIECNASTFVLELRELKYIRQTLTPNSLIIIDELCRGTSSEEGTAIAFAICEDLLQTNAFIFLTTHFLFITKLQDLYCNVVNYHFDVVEDVTSEGRRRLNYTHQLLPGVTQVENYGLLLAESSGMPTSVVAHARKLAVTIAAQRKVTSGSEECNKTERDHFNSVTNLQQLHRAGELTVQMCQDLQSDLAVQEADVQETHASGNSETFNRLPGSTQHLVSVNAPQCDRGIFRTPGPVSPRPNKRKVGPNFSI